MGVCSVSHNKKSKTNTVEALFASSKKKVNSQQQKKSEFYYFVQWILSFSFYKRLRNSPECSAAALIIEDDPKNSTLFKVIKAVDCLYRKDKFASFFAYSNKEIKDKGYVEIEKETLKCLFFHLAKDNVTKLRKILIEGPPHNMRWFIWRAIAKNDYDKAEIVLNITNNDIYKMMLNMELIDQNKEAISKDVRRTNTSKFFFNNFNWQTSLSNVLRAISLYDKQLGYCLGMNTITATSLLVSDFNEEESFLLLRFLYSSEYGLKLREFFIDEFPRINYYAFIVDHLTEIRLPDIYKVIKNIKLDRTMWIFKWLQTLYGFLNIEISVRLWDCIIALGLDFLIKFSLGCLKFCEKQIIDNKEISIENFNETLKKQLNNEKIIKLALSFRIGKETRMNYDQMFFAELIENNLRHTKQRSKAKEEEQPSKRHVKDLLKDLVNEEKKQIENQLQSNKEDEKANNDEEIKVIYKKESIKSNKEENNQDQAKDNEKEKESIKSNNEEKIQDKVKEKEKEGNPIEGEAPKILEEEDIQIIIQKPQEEENKSINEEKSIHDTNDPKFNEKISKIKTIYKNAFNSKGEKLASDEEKQNAIREMKIIYFEESKGQELILPETKMLCSLTEKSYEEFIKEYEDEGRKRFERKSCSNLVHNKFNNIRGNSTNNLNMVYTHGTLTNNQFNHSIQEDKKENLSSSFMISESNENMFSVNKGSVTDLCNININESIIHNQSNEIKEVDDDEKTVFADDNILPVLEENKPKAKSLK